MAAPLGCELICLEKASPPIRLVPAGPVSVGQTLVVVGPGEWPPCTAQRDEKDPSAALWLVTRAFRKHVGLLRRSERGGWLELPKCKP